MFFWILLELVSHSCGLPGKSQTSSFLSVGSFEKLVVYGILFPSVIYALPKSPFTVKAS